ncbi:MAG: GGDEF domain-containing protein [Pseudomonadota bacterium]
MTQNFDYNSVPTEREFVSGLFMTGLIILVVAVALAVGVTWYTTRGYEPQIHFQALRTATILPMIIVPLCVTFTGFRALKDYRQMLLVSRLAHTDEMTNLANRRAFMQRARTLFAETDLSFSGLCMFIVDLDHFKKVNDAYGHEAGDEVLIHASQQMIKALPDDALIARLGGEEFGILAPYSNVAEIHEMAESIRHHVSSKPCAYNEHRIQVSASVGVGIAHPRDTIGSVMTRADNALYEAKDMGRNRFVVAA